jgi:protein phosphatase
VRINNEDSMAYDVDAAVAVLADGMGGLERGEVASQVAVETIVDYLTDTKSRTEAILRQAVEAANGAVREAGWRSESDIGTTVVVWMCTDAGQCFIAHVGDSRVYRIRGGRLKRLTSDHSMVQQMVDDGVLSEAEAETSPHRNVITRALGLEDGIEVDIRSWVYSAGDLFLLCSDGLTDMIREAEIEKAVAGFLADEAGELEGMAANLIERANDAGGFDNVSVLLIRPG